MPAETLSPSASPSPATRSRFVVSERSYPSEPSVDRHDFLQLVLPERGRLEMQIGGARGAAAGVHFALVPSGVEHRYWASGPNRFLILDLAPTLIAEVRERLELPGSLPAEPFPRMGERLAALATLLRAEMAAGGLGEPLIADSLGLYAGSLLIHVHLHPPGTATTHRRSSPAARQLALRTRDYLDAYYLQPLSIGQIADAVGASAAHMQRAFRAHFGETIVSYLHRRRLTRARDLLCATDLSVTEIAFAAGFNDHAYFTRLFTREFGLSPSGYRASL